MNKSLLFLLPVSVLLYGCSTTSKGINLDNCQVQVVPENCANAPGSGPSNPVVNFNKNGITAAPPNVCAMRGSTLVFKITPNPPNSDTATVTVLPKDINDTWLTGTNHPDSGKIEIFIPPWVENLSDHKYAIVVNDGSCLDPRVHVM